MLVIENDGQNIVSSNFWDTELNDAGKLFVSVNAGAIRVLVAGTKEAAIQDMETAKYCIVSRGPWPEVGVHDAIELMWDDESDCPFAVQLTPASCDLLPGEPTGGRTWICSSWILQDGRPTKVVERECHWRRVSRIPCLAPLGRP